MASVEFHGSVESVEAGEESEDREGGDERDNGSAGDSTSSTFSGSDSDDLEPEWLDDVQKNGELFYLELSEGEEEAALAQASANQGVTTNHVRFSEKEAEIITEEKKKKKRAELGTKGEPRLKRLARILRRTRRPSQRRGKDGDGRDPHPASILKNQVGQRSGVTVQQRHLKEACVYLNPKRLAGPSPPPPERGGLLEALLGVVHRPGWGGAEQGDAARGRREERISVHGIVPGSPAARCGQIFIGDVLVAVDDVDVCSENIERVLSCIPGPTQNLVASTLPGHTDFSRVEFYREAQSSLNHIPDIYDERRFCCY